MQLKNIFSGLVTFMCAAIIASSPIQAMEGVDNLTIAQCDPRQKTILLKAFKAANLLLHHSQTALNQIYKIEESKTQADREKQLKASVTDNYIGVKLDLPNIAESYERIFGKYDNRRWNIARRKFASVVPFPFAYLAVCEAKCSGPELAYVYKKSDKNYGAQIGICPAYFKFPLSTVKTLTIYENVSTIELFRAGTIVHELMHTHVMDTTKTHDEEYDLEDVIELSPEEAIDNADSYHVFTILAYNHPKAPKCIRPPSRWRNC